LKIELVRGIETSRWARLLGRCVHKSPFHHEGWARVLATSDTSFDAYWLIATDAGGEYLGGMPLVHELSFPLRRFLSLPYGTYGGLIAADDDKTVMIEMLRALAELLKNHRCNSLFCAIPPDCEPWPEEMRSTLGRSRIVESSTHILELNGDFQSIWKGYQKRNRQVIRKAMSAGTAVSVVSGPKAANTLHGLYARQARRWRRHKPYKYRLIEGCATYEGRAFTQMWQATIDGVVHSSLLAFYDDREVFPWLMGSTPESRGLGVNNYLVSEIIRDACNRGLARVNLGGSMGDPGIEHFKRALGGVKTPTYHYIWDSRVMSMARRVRNLLRRR
jgi:CelD/BcsL family acetyltransferase involved in cellulose biosynthesis